jgi:hypothetical protein
VPVHRRQFIGGILACGCGAQAAVAAEPMRSRIGCYAGQAGGTPTTFKESSGVTKYDRSVRDAVDLVSRTIGRHITAAVRFMDDYNALYSPADNVVAFGVPLLESIHGSDFDLKVTCIVAHEVAHIFQSEDGYFDLAQTDATVRRNELMADHFAGCCLAFIVNGGRRIDRGKLYRSKNSVQSAFQLMFSRGDSNFTNPNHHGTPSERLDAVDWGYETAFEVAGGNPAGDISTAIMDVARFGQR